MSFQSSVDDSVQLRSKTVGRVHPHVECKIVDENGDTTALGEQGEVCLCCV